MRLVLRPLSLVLIALVAGPAWGQPSVPIGELLQSLRAGGYGIVFRHGGTQPDQVDTDPLNHDNVARQRQLNDQGRADARAVGEAFGKDWFGIREGEAAIFKPEGGKAVLVARVQIGQWPAAR